MCRPTENNMVDIYTALIMLKNFGISSMHTCPDGHVEAWFDCESLKTMFPNEKDLQIECKEPEKNMTWIQYRIEKDNIVYHGGEFVPNEIAD